MLKLQLFFQIYIYVLIFSNPYRLILNFCDKMPIGAFLACNSCWCIITRMRANVIARVIFGDCVSVAGARGNDGWHNWWWWLHCGWSGGDFDLDR